MSPVRQQQRPRHVPQRTCTGCRSRLAKRELVRIVRAPDGGVRVDPTGRAPGRGAYLHLDPACWAEGLKKGRLARALHCTITPEDRAVLETFMELRLSEGVGRPAATASDAEGR